MNRRSPQWWFKHIAVSLALGLLLSVLLIARWERAYADSRITVLGSGDGLSTLIDLASTRVLIVAGDDPGEFANALADARPSGTPRIDLVIVAPGAMRVATRVIEIADPARVLVIESPMQEIAPPDWASMTTIISTVSTIVIQGQARLEIDPGYSIDSAMAGWSIRIRSDAGEMLVSEHAPHVDLIGVKAYVIAGPDAGVLIPSDAPRVASSTIPLSRPEGVIQVAPGRTMRIDI